MKLPRSAWIACSERMTFAERNSPDQKIDTPSSEIHGIEPYAGGKKDVGAANYGGVPTTAGSEVDGRRRTNGLRKPNDRGCRSRRGDRGRHERSSDGAGPEGRERDPQHPLGRNRVDEGHASSWISGAGARALRTGSAAGPDAGLRRISLPGHRPGPERSRLRCRNPIRSRSRCRY